MAEDETNNEPMGVAEADAHYANVGKSLEEKAELDEHEVVDPTVNNPQQPQFPAPIGMPAGYTDDKPGYHGGSRTNPPGGERTGVGETSTASLPDPQTVGDQGAPAVPPVEQPPTPDSGAGESPASGDQGDQVGSFEPAEGTETPLAPGDGGQVTSPA